MPPRLNHRKSTTGCLRCKARKVKCDEKRPHCGHCARHNVLCEYPGLMMVIYNPRPSKFKPTNAVACQRCEESPWPGLPSPGLGGRRILELRLMHHWVTVTAGTMSSAQLSSVREMWNVSVPQMAFEYEPLLHTLLALAAAHRATLLPGEASSLRPISYGYMDFALKWHRSVTGKLDDNTSESVCLNAVLLSLYTFFLRSEGAPEPYEPPILWLSMARGIHTIMRTAYDQLMASNSRLCPLLVAQPTIWQRESSDSDEIRAKPFNYLLKYHREEMTDMVKNAYSGTITYLEYLYVAVQNREPDFVIRKIFNGFPPVVPKLFLDFVREKRPRALAIIAHLFALAKGVENIWWLCGIPEQEVRGIDSIMPADWKWALAWPLGIIAQDPPANGASSSVTMRDFIDTLF
ncbi:hypothetical protein BDV39DRAFT_181094 [Aspergillus sergii]|uniref:Zn(2)-C6 fungal-type domain-containing protein n=1 Tax=Aspergillus sergii TaxID=1034303 RepID=A0A5N6WT00_9EURO|nr:hypothetical protein BDV39DRAFT_181094 [Aspergillus sergii]